MTSELHNWDPVQEDVFHQWDSSVLPALSRYITVPNQSPDFDSEWKTNGLTQKAFDVLLQWMLSLNLKGFSYQYVDDGERTPFLLVEVEGSEPMANTVLIYGHMDKQPPLYPWDEGLDPYTPTVVGDKLYGRGSSDDGYAFFAALQSIASLQKNGISHGSVKVIIESCEESGSFDLPYYMERFKENIGDVDLMICLDSGCLNYDQLWLTTSLRGVTGGILHVQTLTEGMHSGVAGGVVPDSFRILRVLLDRIESASTGEVLLPEAHCEIPAHVKESLLPMETIPFKEQFALYEGVHCTSERNADLALNNFWKPSLTVTGADLPDPKTAGNVIRSSASVKLSLRLPPPVDSEKATQALEKVLTENPPYGARVWFEAEAPGNGCSMPQLHPWLDQTLREASHSSYGQPYACQGMGGAIPFISMLQQMYPSSQFLVTGVLGPKSNAHGPNEFLNLSYVKRLTLCLCRVLAAHFRHSPKAK